MDQIEVFGAAIALIDEEVNANIEPFRAAIVLLKNIPGTGDLGAETIAADRHRHEAISDCGLVS